MTQVNIKKPRHGNLLVRKQKGVWLDPKTGFFHQWEAPTIYRPDGTVDHGIRSTKAPDGSILEGVLPRGAQINPRRHGVQCGNNITLRVAGCDVNAAALAWSIHHGEMVPKGTRFDHADGDPWCNTKDNLIRMGRLQHQAATWIGGVYTYLGMHATREAAVAAVNAARAAVGLGEVKTRNRNPKEN